MEYLIKTESIGGMTEDQFFRFCQENDSIRFERNAQGEIIIMEPTESYTGWFNINIATDLTNWNRKTGLGIVFDSSTGFTLPNGAVRSPDACFITKGRWENLREADREKFAHVCPDFVIELLSKSDLEWKLQEKMHEWMDNGCRLGWMINPDKKETTIYRENGETQIIPFNQPLHGENVVPGLVMDLSGIFTSF